ncbi:hypothetical protein ACFVAD_12520 [Sutcliffiella sp. NPDC057660]|uniref:hypothetical protein n=1 Tax=Sutcliffiella sp. NPDC057660 TaxID=3346199 RepID=UPI003687DA90
MRVIYSVLREIHRKEFIPDGSHYGLKELEFEQLIRFLENERLVERVLRGEDSFSIKIARLTLKGKELLNDYQHYEENYPKPDNLRQWVKVEKDLYSNGAEAPFACGRWE